MPAGTAPGDRPRVLCWVHQRDAGPGVFAAAATELGVVLDTCLVPEEPLPDLDGYDALVVMGASADTDQEDRHPWLRREKPVLRQALARELPTLGVCLGGQLLAEAAGARVGRLAVAEIGWMRITLDPAAAADPLFGPAGAPPPLLQWHHCSFELPRGAQLLATGETGVQAFRLGRAWALQFHPEVTPAIVGGWIDDDGDGPEARAAGVLSSRLREETGVRIGASMQFGRRLFQDFLRQLDGG